MRATLERSAKRAVLAVVIGCFGFAEALGPPNGGGGTPPDPRGESSNGLSFGASDANQILLWSASLSGAGLDHKNQGVSGTRAEFTLAAGLGLAIPPLVPQGTAVLGDTDHPSRLTNYLVEIQNPQGTWETVDSQPGPFTLTTQQPGQTVQTPLRVATTAWANGGTINVRVSFDVSYYYFDSTNTLQGPITPPHFTHTFPVLAYNVMQLAGTVVAEYYYPNPPPQDPSIWFYTDALIQTCGSNLMSGGATAAGTLNHGTLPSSVPAACNQQASDILANIAPSTVAFLNLHGHTNTLIGGWLYDFLADSNGWTQANWTNPQNPPHAAASAHAVNTQAIAQATGGKAAPAWIPPFNMVFLYSCDTVSSWGWTVDTTFPSAFGIIASSVDKAYLGFGTPINAACWTAADWTAAQDANVNDPYKISPNRIVMDSYVWQHAGVFWSQITAGQNVQQAKADADAAFPMVYATHDPTLVYHSGDEYQWPWYTTTTTVVGDNLTRLWYVYLNATEQAGYPGDSWKRFWVKL